jgi:hypothetical protein
MSCPHAFARSAPERAQNAAFDLGFALRLRGVSSFDALRSVVGSEGEIVERSQIGGHSYAVYRWPDSHSPAASELRVRLFESGDFGATIGVTGRPASVTFNSFGAFVCPSCAPPVDACGRRPSWVDRDVHWDVFDCRCTLLGPAGGPDSAC